MAETKGETVIACDRCHVELWRGVEGLGPRFRRPQFDRVTIDVPGRRTVDYDLCGDCMKIVCDKIAEAATV